MTAYPDTARRPWWRRLRGGDLGSYRRQAVAATAVLGTLAAVALIVVVQIAFSESVVDAADRVLQARADSVVRSAETASSSAVLRVPRSQLGPGVVVYDADGHVVAGEASPALADRTAELAVADRPTTQKLGDWVELLAQPFTTSSGASGVVVVAERLDPYQDQEWDALAVAMAAGVVIVVATTGVAAWATKKALAPVCEMASTAEDWSEHDLGRRFDLGDPTNEIRSLGHTLDGLLDRVALAILAEQRLTSELAHEIRSPLTAIQGTAELIGMRDDLDAELRDDVEEIQAQCRAMAQIVTSLLDLARTQAETGGHASCTVAEVLDRTLPEVDGSERVHLAGSGDLAAAQVAVPPELAVRSLAPVVTNAVQHAENVTVFTRMDDRWVDVVVADDGPGIDPAVEVHLFESGWTGGSGSGLGLALARRVARSIGGDVTARTGSDAGAEFTVRLPRHHGPVTAPVVAPDAGASTSPDSTATGGHPTSRNHS